jgi:hypothetical protein
MRYCARCTLLGVVFCCVARRLGMLRGEVLCGCALHGAMCDVALYCAV